MPWRLLPWALPSLPHSGCLVPAHLSRCSPGLTSSRKPSLKPSWAWHFSGSQKPLSLPHISALLATHVAPGGLSASPRQTGSSLRAEWNLADVSLPDPTEGSAQGGAAGWLEARAVDDCTMDKFTDIGGCFSGNLYVIIIITVAFEVLFRGRLDTSDSVGSRTEMAPPSQRSWSGRTAANQSSP